MSSLPTLWQTSNPGLATLSLDTTVFHSGSASAKIAASTGTSSTKTGFFITPVAPIVPGSKYIFSYWAKATGDPGGVSQGIAVYNDADDNFLDSASPAPIASGTTDWTRYSVNMIAPLDASYVQLFLVTYANSGTVWFDDVAIILAPIVTRYVSLTVRADLSALNYSPATRVTLDVDYTRHTEVVLG